MKRHRTSSSTDKSRRAIWQIGAVVGVLILVVVVLTLKRTVPSATASVEASLTVVPSAHEGAASDSDDNPLLPAPDELPHAHVERLLNDGHPVFLFFHSTTCYQCIEMTKIVEQVYPDFSSQVALVAVNVYEERSQTLLQQAGIRVIPTLIFVDRDGQGQGTTGVMPAEQLETMLRSLSSGDTP